MLYVLLHTINTALEPCCNAIPFQCTLFLQPRLIAVKFLTLMVIVTLHDCLPASAKSHAHLLRLMLYPAWEHPPLAPLFVTAAHVRLLFWACAVSTCPPMWLEAGLACCQAPLRTYMLATTGEHS